MANPIFLSENMPAPTLPMTNSGPEVEQAHARICASSSENPVRFEGGNEARPDGISRKNAHEKAETALPARAEKCFRKG